MPLPSPEFPTSGAQGLIGYEIRLIPEDGTAEVSLDVGPQHLNRNGTLHGGLIASLLDSAAGFAASLSFGGAVLMPVVTVSLTTHFLAPAREGLVVSTGQVAGGGRKIIYADAEVRDAEGVLVAKGSGVFKRAG